MLSAWAIIIVYLSILVLMALYGAHRLVLLRLLARSSSLQATRSWAHPPTITVQLPVYNEPEVIERLLDAVARLDWPAEQLQIQLLDDSTDHTRSRARQAIARLAAGGVQIECIRRSERTGYKAGALAHGLKTATGEFIAILDADFVPEPDFLKRLMPHFVDGVGMVQARWTHLNRDQDWLTRMQALLLDGHFVIEHAARHASGRFFNFNGTAGIWRRSCIEDAGGWTHDTITEDLDLSYRAQLAGWRFVFLPDVLVPAELPLGMSAFLTQQHRWAKGTVQTARKLLGTILVAPQPWRVRLEAWVHLSSPVGYPLLIALAILLPPTVAARARLGLSGLDLVDLVVVSLTTGSIGLFFASALTRQGRRLRDHIWELPMTMALGVGLCASQTLAVLDGLLGADSTFVRTPKLGSTAGTARPTQAWTAASALSWGLALYYAAVIPWAAANGHWGSMPFILLFAAGFWMVALGLSPRLRPGFSVPSGAEAAPQRDEARAAK
jgi:cellulose synthase/poly-beta-1,6-N-acetylglucosamine synthase-like glycosyltransferase